MGAIGGRERGFVLVEGGEMRWVQCYACIRECGSTLYVGMVRVVSFFLYIGIGAKFRNRLKTAKTSLCRVKDRTAML